MEKFEHEYNAEQIQVLEGLEAVRKRVRLQNEEIIF